MNKILTGIVIGLLLGLGMMVFAQDKKSSLQSSNRIGSDAFFGQDPQEMRQKILQPPPPPKPPEEKNVKGRAPATSKQKAGKEEISPSNTDSSQRFPAERNGLETAPGVLKEGPQTEPAPEGQKPSEDYIRGY